MIPATALDNDAWGYGQALDIGVKRLKGTAKVFKVNFSQLAVYGSYRFIGRSAPELDATTPKLIDWQQSVVRLKERIDAVIEV